MRRARAWALPRAVVRVSRGGGDPTPSRLTHLLLKPLGIVGPAGHPRFAEFLQGMKDRCHCTPFIGQGIFDPGWGLGVGRARDDLLVDEPLQALGQRAWVDAHGNEMAKALWAILQFS